MDILTALKKDFIIGDGGVGVMLQKRGIRTDECGELWNLERAGDVEAVHRAFVDAGSELIETNSFQANRIVLKRHGLEDKVEEINQAAVQIARRAAEGKNVFVVASFGPSGELMEPYGDLTADEVKSAFEEQANALADTDIDGVFVETFTAIEEIEIAVRAVKAAGLTVAASMSFQPSGATVMGVKPEQAVSRLKAAGADIIGANCGMGPAELFPIMQEFKKHYDGLIIAQPNAGMPKLVDGKTVFPETPEVMADYAVQFGDLGVNIIGGCCGTRPEHIKAMVEKLRG